MSLNRLWSFLPGRRALLTVVFSSLAGAGLASAILTWAHVPGLPSPKPEPPHDPRFVALGKTYMPQLGKAYAAAWDEGANQLELGKDIAAALEVVSKPGRRTGPNCTIM